MKETIIQFGEGNFLRGFFDYFLHGLNKKGLYEGKAVIVQPLPEGRCGIMNAQGCKYNLYLRGIDGGEVREEHTLVESVSRCVDPYADFDGYMSLADAPDFRFIASNTTEAGIEFDPACKFEDRPCRSFPGKLTQLLYRRYEKGLPGFIVLSCELIDNNGRELHRCVLEYADLWGLGDDFKRWINEENSFANTLVDRIVTGYPTDETAEKHPDDKMLDTAELFHLWVIEGDFENELPLRAAGYNVIWTDDVKPYKKIKVRILNGAHTSMVPGAILAGLETVGECMKDEDVRAYLSACVKGEILPTIGETEESIAFAAKVYDRFENPFIRHRLRSIALNSVSKFSVRVLPTMLEYREKHGEYPKALTMSLALLLSFYKNDTPEDSEYAVNALKNGTVAEILGNEDLWSQDISDLAEKVTECMEKIEALGARGAMKWILSR